MLSRCSWSELTARESDDDNDDDDAVDGKGAINQFNIESASIEHAGMMSSVCGAMRAEDFNWARGNSSWVYGQNKVVQGMDI